MNYNERMQLLKNTPVFWSRLGIGYDPPKRGDDGRWLLFSRDFDKYRYLHKSFYDIGVKIHSAVLPNGWLGCNEYDYSDVDEILETIMGIGEDFYFLPRVKLTPPIAWCHENPEEVFVYSDGPRDATSIQQLVGSLKQDILGYNSPTGYNANGGKLKDPRPNMDGIIGMQSFSSEKWLEDAGDALKRLIKHIETKPYASRILGFHIAYGNCGETAMWGSWNQPYQRHGDYSLKNLEKFISYYPTAKEIPAAKLMFCPKDNLDSHFRTNYPECAAFSQFTSDINIKACSHFCKIVKDASPDYVAGIFYGYILGQPNCSNSGHLAIDQALECKYIDFIASPKGYYKYGPFGPGLEQCPCNSIARKKLYIDEIDNLTHLHPYTNVPDKAADFEETKTILVREFCKNMAFDQGYWWMDLGEGCFDSEEIMALIGDLNQLSSRLKNNPTQNTSEVLIVIDDESMHYTTPSFAYHDSFIKDFVSNIKMCGAPVMLIRKQDLYEIDLKQFKIVFFLNCFKTNQKFEALVHNGFAQGTVLVWNYAAGYCSDSPGSDGTKRLTSFAVADYNGKLPTIPNSTSIDFPGICIVDDGNIDIIRRYADGTPMIASNQDKYGMTNVLCSLPLLTVDEIYQLIRNSGAYTPATAHCTVYGNNKFIAFFANETICFTFHLPDSQKIEDPFTGCTHTGPIDINLQKGRFQFFILK